MEPQTVDAIGNFRSFVARGSRTLASNVRTVARSAKTQWRESSTLTKACIIGVPTALAAPLLIIPTLSVVGFTSAGVAAGSIAASLQTATTVSGSIFALCQSAGATGIVATSTSLGVGLTAGLTTGGVTAAVFRRRTDNTGQENDEQAEVNEEDNAEDETDISPD